MYWQNVANQMPLRGGLSQNPQFCREFWHSDCKLNTNLLVFNINNKLCNHTNFMFYVIFT